MSLVIIGILIKFDVSYSIRLLRIVAIGIVVERTIVLIIFSEYLTLPIVLIEILIGIIYVWLSDNRDFTMYLLKKKQLTTTTRGHKT